MTQIHWTNPISDVFSNGADWSGGVVPGASDDAILDASGGAFTVTSSVSETVSSIQTAANATLAITGGAFTATGGTGAGVNAGLTSVVNGGTFSVGGVIDNAGTIEALGQIGQTSPEIAIGIGGGALSGGGTIALAAATGTGGNTGDAVLYGSTKASLTNIDNTIAGAGVIYVNSLLINGAKGVIDANRATGGGLIVNGTIANDGLIEATNGGVVNLDTVDGSGGGVILADGGSVELSNVIGGTLETVGGSIMTMHDGVLDGATSVVNNRGTLRIMGSGGQITVQGTINNTGTIVLPDLGSLEIGAAGVAFTGGGQMTFANFHGVETVYARQATTFTNVDNNINGTLNLGGLEGSPAFTLVNEAKGIINANVTGPMIVDTGANTVINVGLIEASAAGGLVVKSAIDNTGELKAVSASTLVVDGAVSGNGVAVINGGRLIFKSSFSEKVIFNGTSGPASASGLLLLEQSQTYAGSIVNFAHNVHTVLDLRDIAFVGAGEATYSGTAQRGTLTVTDGTHTSHIALQGNYLGVVFKAKSDGFGGTSVFDVAKAAASHHTFVAAAASLGGGAGGAASMTHDAWRAPEPMLAKPGVVSA